MILARQYSTLDGENWRAWIRCGDRGWEKIIVAKVYWVSFIYEDLCRRDTVTKIIPG